MRLTVTGAGQSVARGALPALQRKRTCTGVRYQPAADLRFALWTEAVMVGSCPPGADATVEADEPAKSASPP